MLLSATVWGQSIQERVKKFDKPKDYKVEYDKFQKYTTVEFTDVAWSTKKDSKHDGWYLTVIATISDSGNVSFDLYFRPSSRFLFTQATLRILYDGELMEIPSRTIGYSALYNLSPDQFQKIIASKSVEVQISIFEGKISDKTLIKMRNLASLK